MFNFADSNSPKSNLPPVGGRARDVGWKI